MASTINCWQCGSRLTGLILPLSRREECANCGAEQHVCKLCKHFNPAISDSCEEDLAEDVRDKESANFCDYFSVNPNAYQPKKQTKQEQAEHDLACLFGDSTSEEKAPTDERLKTVNNNKKALSALEKLFSNPPSEK